MMDVIGAIVIIVIAAVMLLLGLYRAFNDPNA